MTLGSQARLGKQEQHFKRLRRHGAPNCKIPVLHLCYHDGIGIFFQELRRHCHMLLCYQHVVHLDALSQHLTLKVPLQ